MSLLFADIYEAIRCLRIQKGACEKDILNYVQDKVGGCMKVKNVLKTIRTLKKLVDDGVLIKNGKRYSFSKKKQSDDNEEEDEEECEEKPEDCKELDDCEDDDDDQADDDDDDEDDDEDDDDDDDDEDEDEEDDEECEEKNDEEFNDENPPDEECDVTENQNRVTNENAAMKPSPKKVTNSVNDNGNKNGDHSAKPQDKNNGKKAASIGSQNKNVIDQNGNAKNKGGDAIAFCVRDFIDSLHRPKSKSKEREKHHKLEILPQENMDATERCNISKEKKQKYQKKISGVQQCNYRSRSPIRDTDRDVFTSLRRDRMDEIRLRAISSTLLQEPTDADMEIDVEQERDVVGSDVDAFRRATSAGPKPPTTPSLLSPRQNTSEIRKTEPSTGDDNEYVLKKNIQYSFSELDEKEAGQMSWYALDGKSKMEKYKVPPSIDDERNVNDDEENVSLCSVCEKKKIAS